MLDLLKKIGVPGTVAAVVASLVTMVPFLFQVDERYAKADDVTRLIEKLERRNQRLEREISQLSGFQEAMVKFIQEGRLPRAAEARVGAAPTPAPAPAAAPAPRPALTVPVPTLEPPVRSLIETDPARRAPPRAQPSLDSLPATAAGASAPEKPSDWRELREGLMRQQQRLSKD